MPRRERAREQERVLIGLVLVEVVLCQGDSAEFASSICLERKIGHQVDQREFIPLILNAGAEMDAEFHDRPLRFLTS